MTKTEHDVVGHDTSHIVTTVRNRATKRGHVPMSRRMKRFDSTEVVSAPARTSSRSRDKRPRGDHGVAIVEFALLLPFLAVLVFGVVDLGRAWQLQNRLSNAAREGAEAVQFFPYSVNLSCRAGNNAISRAREEEPGLASEPGYLVTVAKLTGGVATAYTTPTCAASSPTMTISPGDTLRVTVQADHDVITPLIGGLTGDPILVKRSVDVVVQG
jgi:Flp pilus assembly protein TadG